MSDNRPGKSALAALVAAPALTLVAHLVQVSPTAHDTASELASIAAHPDRYQISGLIGFLSMVLWVPGLVALGAAVRVRKPRLATAGVVMSVPGVLALTALMGSGPYSQAMAQAPQRAAMIKATDVGEGLPLTSVWVLVMLVGFVLGPVVLGVGVWRSGHGWAVPALLVAGVVVQMADAGRWPLAVGYLLTTAGMAAAAAQVSRSAVHPSLSEPVPV